MLGFSRWLICFLVILISYHPLSVNGQVVTDGFYSQACPLAESIVRATVKNYFRAQPSIAPGLFKLHYIDCIVNGCDGSVLISGPNTERTAIANLIQPGFEIIKAIKLRTEVACPRTVSCADILALAAREAVVLANGPSWNVKSGRRDGRVSLAANVKKLTSQSGSITQLVNKFAAFELNTHDFVALFGQHVIGTVVCKFTTNGIISINGSTIDLTIDPLYLAKLQSLCPKDGDSSSQHVSNTSTFKNVLSGSSVSQADLKRTLIQRIKHFITTFLTDQQLGILFDEASKGMYRVSDSLVTDEQLNEVFTWAMSRVTMSGMMSGVGVYAKIRETC